MAASDYVPIFFKYRLHLAGRPQMSTRPRRYSVFFEVRTDLAWVVRSISGGGCCSPAIAHQTLT
jgi:hypothetical protein